MRFAVAVLVLLASACGAFATPEATLSYVANTQPPDAYLSLRTDPSTTVGKRITTMPNGTRLEVLVRQADGWWRVRVVPSGQEGWVFSGAPGKKWVECCTSAETSQANGEKPSFDCAIAKSASARLICSDPELSKADAEMGVAYRSALNEGKDAGDQKAVKDMQLAWIKSRNTRCGLEGKSNAPIEELTPAKPCFLEAYKKQKVILITAFTGASGGSANGLDGNTPAASTQEVPQNERDAIAKIVPPPKEEEQPAAQPIAKREDVSVASNIPSPVTNLVPWERDALEKALRDSSPPNTDCRRDDAFSSHCGLGIPGGDIYYELVTDAGGLFMRARILTENPTVRSQYQPYLASLLSRLSGINQESVNRCYAESQMLWDQKAGNIGREMHLNDRTVVCSVTPGGLGIGTIGMTAEVRYQKRF